MQPTRTPKSQIPNPWCCKGSRDGHTYSGIVVSEDPLCRPRPVAKQREREGLIGRRLEVPPRDGSPRRSNEYTHRRLAHCEHHVHAVQTPYPTLHTFSSLPGSPSLFLALLLSSSSSRFSLLPAHVIKLDVTVGTGRCEPHSNDHGLVQRMHPGKEHSGRCMRMRTFHQVTTHHHHSFHLSDVT